MFDEICKTFKISEITDNQRKAIVAVINGHDVFVGTRTGSGKSLTNECLPIVRPKSITLVIAPLVTIMSEQCSKLERLGFRVTYIGKETENIKRGIIQELPGFRPLDYHQGIALDPLEASK
uniref:Bloom syndrome-like protein n=1 Tax=Magallana gigas TaxID=29159 RepID=K1Q7D6_MAGGI